MLPDATAVLCFSGPTCLSVRGHSYPLPLPEFTRAAVADRSFREQVYDLYDKKFVLYDVIDQRCQPYYVFTKLPAAAGQPRVNLKTIRMRVRQEPEYHAKHLLRDVAQMGRCLPLTLPQLRLGQAKTAKWIRRFSQLQNSLAEEVEEFESCPDCIGNYYVFDDPFLIPCRKVHSLVVISRPPENYLMPAKVLAIDPVTDRAKVALFDGSYKRQWLPRSDCVLLSMRQTWQHIWRTDWSRPRNQFERAFASLFRHLLMMTARFGLWFVGAETGGQLVSQATLCAPFDTFFAPLSSCGKLIDTLHMNVRPLPLVSLQPEAEEKENRRPRQRKDTRVKCRRRGCRKRGGKTWGTECLLCDVKYCSWNCAQEDMSTHVFACSMAKVDVDIEYLKTHPLQLGSETGALVSEALAQDPLLFGTNHSLQLFNCGVEEMLQGQD